MSFLAEDMKNIYFRALLLSTVLFAWPFWAKSTISTSMDSLHHSRENFWTPANNLDRDRLLILTIGGGVTYTASSLALYQFWYRDQNLTNFHFFNDWKEWKRMDKAGHSYSGYMLSEMGYRLLNWAGVENNSAIWLGSGTSLLFLTTIEVMDGFAEKWGFSWHDMAFNVIGTGMFAAQQFHWKDQRIRLKFSYSPVQHSNVPILSSDGEYTTTREIRANDLFGSSFSERLVKDYNGQKYWISTSLNSWFENGTDNWDWLSLAVGMGAGGIYGGAENSWVENGVLFEINESRYHRFFLSPDVDWSRIQTDSGFLRFLFDGLNWIKFPAPALEIDSRGRINFHWILF